MPFLLALVFMACNQKEKTTIDETRTINYEVLRSWNIPTWHTRAGGLGMELLVPDSTTRAQSLELAESFRKKRKSGEFLTIQIFDSREAYDNRENLDYSEEEYFKHFLVDMTINPNTGFDEIAWVAKGRDH